MPDYIGREPRERSESLQSRLMKEKLQSNISLTQISDYLTNKESQFVKLFQVISE